jgi:hypothetical protein
MGKKVIISESRLNDFIYEYLTTEYHPDYNWGPELHDFYRKDIAKHGFHDFAINDRRAYAYRGQGRGELLIRTWVEYKLDSLFGDRWRPVFVKWFEDNSGLPVKKIIYNWDMD